MSNSFFQPQDFQSVLAQIQQPRTRAFAQANTSLIELNCHIGQTISQRVQSAGWGIGLSLRRDKDDEVVEYALSRNPSPALIAEYHLQLPDKKLLQARLHEILANVEMSDGQ
jgi:hypothetical protein